ncbi:MAG: GlsB/YeaQ/YmgE family stress response membrane protein [Anaerolineaceae bacterium]
MGLFITILVGLVAGLIASTLMKANTSWFADIFLGIAGSLLGGWISSLISGENMVTGFNLTSILISIAGAALVIYLYRLIKK